MENNNVRVLGTLIDREELQRFTGDPYKKPIFMNKQSAYQFVVEAISETPDDFFDIRTFTVFEDQLSPEIDEIFDVYKYCSPEKIEEWFSKRAVVFTPKRNNTGHFQAEDTIKVVDLPPLHTVNTKYAPIPMFDLKKIGITLNEFEEKLRYKEWINVFPGVSTSDEDVFPMIMCYWNDSCYIYGNILSKDYDEYNGIRLAFENDVIKRAEFNFSDGNKIVVDDVYHVIFIPNALINEYEQKLCSIEYEAAEQTSEQKDVLAETQASSEERPVQSQPVPENQDGLKNVYVDNNAEAEFLKQFIEIVNNDGMLYDEADLIDFHVAMKSSNLVILSGMSGTGKSRLVRLYAKAIGLNEKSANRLKVVPVKPSWTDDSDLLGYLDTTNMVYRPADTGIVDVLAEAAKNTNGINIICLDEMNLSRVEHYFSQFLSILEGNENERVIRLYNPNIENRVYNASDYPAEIKIGKNVFFVGTVNVDESTYHFSDKVLDRANVIKLHNRNFSDLKNLLSKEKKDIVIKPITMKIFSSFKNNQSDDMFILTDEEVNLLNELNNVMINNLPNCAIGYRIIRQIDLYLKNLPETSVYPKDKAFDYLLVQRVFTKLRGSVDQLKVLVGKFDENGSLVDSLILDILQKYNGVSSFDESKKIIANKAKELVMYGYTI